MKGIFLSILILSAKISFRVYPCSLLKCEPVTISFKSKKSPYVEEVKKKLDITSATTTNIANKLSRNEDRRKQIKKGLELIKDKGEGAYFSSGSRPNQTPQSWGIGRYSSVLVGGPSRKIDKKIVDKYKIPKI